MVTMLVVVIMAVVIMSIVHIMAIIVALSVFILVSSLLLPLLLYSHGHHFYYYIGVTAVHSFWAS